MTIQDLLNAGFEMKMPIKNYLYGKSTELTEIKSTIQPDYLFVKGDKSISISYNGCLVEFDDNVNRDEFDKIVQLIENGKVYFIQLSNGNDIVHRNYYGIFPTNEQLTEFIS